MIKKRSFKILAVFTAINILTSTVAPTLTWALTSGPTQPEVASFEPVGTTDMVSLFTGDFTYNIPLFELPGPNGGYPFNLAYHSGVGMEQEASWVGLGWTLNPGAITRQMRGLPDEFDGTDQVKIKQDMKPSHTFGVGVGGGVELLGSDKLAANVGLRIYNNNYKGIGYGIEAGISFNSAGNSDDRTGAGLGLNVSLDSQEGISFRPSLSISAQVGAVTGSFNAGIGYNSMRGMTDMTLGSGLSFSTDETRLVGFKRQGKNRDIKNISNDIGGSSSLSFANTGYTPAVTIPMRGKNITGTFKMGGAVFGIFGNAYIRGFYSEQSLTDRNKEVRTPAYGYLHLGENTSTKVVQDFNREKDGALDKSIPNLAIPSLTYDIYNIQGQGIGGMFRPYRNDFGIVHDQQIESTVNGGSFGVDVGPGFLPHFGVSVELSEQKSKTDKWHNGDNDLSDVLAFQTANSRVYYEPYYFKVHGETTIDDLDEMSSIGNTSALRPDLKTNGKSHLKKEFQINNTLSKHNGGTVTLSNFENILSARESTANGKKGEKREPRNQAILAVTNDLLGGSKQYEYTTSYYNLNENGEPVGAATTYTRPTNKNNHIGAYSILKPDGMRYVYGLPAKNIEQKEFLFSVKNQNYSNNTRLVSIDENNGQPNYKDGNTDAFYKESTTPEYPHSYMLTAVLGSDYVDVTGDGVTADDFGYWCKFTYGKANDYHWRTPFNGANYNEGSNTTDFDDKASFMAGKRESYYLKKVESKSHIAIFNLSKRQDGRGANVSSNYVHNNKNLSQEGNANTMGAYSYQLDKISLYARPEYEDHNTDGVPTAEAIPIKEIHFDYDYALCQGVYNNTTNNGKLTLKKVYFTYKKSRRGALSPYQFAYYNEANNPDYDTFQADRWGSYRPGYQPHFPYVDQYNTDPADLHHQVASWNLSQVKLPSGGKINIDYESDDYAYVQNKIAGQMTPITGVGQQPTSDNQICWSCNQLEHNGQGRTLYFQTEHPISQDSDLDPYFKEIKQVYFKVMLRLRRRNEAVKELISGYADYEAYGMAGTNTGWVRLKKVDGYNPITLAGWQYLRTVRPDLANTVGKVSQAKDNAGTSEKANKVKALLSIIPQVKQVFKGFYRYCDGKDWSKTIDIRETVQDEQGNNVNRITAMIRLNTPDKIKYGGGLRVKRLTLNDEWSSMTTSTKEKSSEYGQVYDYTMKEGNETISSGVAAYEPMIGADENPLRYAKQYNQKIPLKSDLNLTFEYPVNESYYPAPTVGYRKITVKSLATAEEESNHEGILTTGKQVHEFYTAKEFPVIAHETSISMKQHNVFVPIPLLGSINVNKMAASQGYSIELNDMHGKPRKVSEFGQDKDGNYFPEPYKYTLYHYLENNAVSNGKSCLVPKNEVQVLMGATDPNDPTKADIRTMRMGQDYEFFADMRQNSSQTVTGGVNVNVDLIPIFILFGFLPIPIVRPFPSVGYANTETRTAVTNKVIYRTGIMSGTTNYVNGATVKESYEVYDQTGKPVLVKSTNLFTSSSASN